MLYSGNTIFKKFSLILHYSQQLLVFVYLMFIRRIGFRYVPEIEPPLGIVSSNAMIYHYFNKFLVIIIHCKILVQSKFT